MAKYQERVNAWFAEKYPAAPPEVQAEQAAQLHIDKCRRIAAELRALASRGMDVRRLNKRAAELEAEAAWLIDMLK